MTKSGKPPAFQFYAKDWISSKAVRMMNPRQRGYYIQLMAEAWDNTPIGHLPNEPEVLRVLALEPDLKEWELNHRLVIEQFKVRGKLIYSPRLCAERKKQSAYKENKRKAGTASANARKEKKLNVNRTPTQEVTEINSSSSSSSSSSTSVKEQELKPSTPPPARAPKITDPRFTHCVEILHRYWHRWAKNIRFELWFDAAGGKQLKNALARHKAMTVEEFTNCVANRARSPGVKHNEPFYLWGGHILEWAAGPKGANVNGRGSQQTSKADAREQRIVERAIKYRTDTAREVDSEGTDPLAVSGDGATGIHGLADEPEILPPRQN